MYSTAYLCTFCYYEVTADHSTSFENMANEEWMNEYRASGVRMEKDRTFVNIVLVVASDVSQSCRNDLICEMTKKNGWHIFQTTSAHTAHTTERMRKMISTLVEINVWKDALFTLYSNGECGGIFVVLFFSRCRCFSYTFYAAQFCCRLQFPFSFHLSD